MGYFDGFLTTLARGVPQYVVMIMLIHWTTSHYDSIKRGLKAGYKLRGLGLTEAIDHLNLD